MHINDHKAVNQAANVQCRVRMRSSVSCCVNLFFFVLFFFNANVTLALFIYNSCTDDQSYVPVISDWSAGRWLRVWLQQVTWAGMHPAPPRPLAFQEQPSMSDHAAFSSSLLCCYMKETCLCLIRESFLLNKWVVYEGENKTGLFQLGLGFTVNCSHIAEMFALPCTTHKGLCLCVFVVYYAVEVQLLSNLR